MNASSFNGKVALVTGASRGIGRATALLLAQRGCSVALLARSRDDLNAVRVEIEALGQRAFVAPVSISDELAVEGAVAEAVASLGRLDILINNAGVTHDATLLSDLSLDEWRRVLATNLDGSFLVTRACLPHLRTSGAGAIVFNGSMSGETPFPRKGAYSVSKAGIASLTKLLAAEEGPNNIRVNALAGGPIETDMTEYLHSHPEVRRVLLYQIPLARMGTAEETAEALVFLTSDEARFLTGAVIPFAGGMVTLPQGPDHNPYYVGKDD